MFSSYLEVARNMTKFKSRRPSSIDDKFQMYDEKSELMKEQILSRWVFNDLSNMMKKQRQRFFTFECSPHLLFRSPHPLLSFHVAFRLSKSRRVFLVSRVALLMRMGKIAFCISMSTPECLRFLYAFSIREKLSTVTTQNHFPSTIHSWARIEETAQQHKREGD